MMTQFTDAYMRLEGKMSWWMGAFTSKIPLAPIPINAFSWQATSGCVVLFKTVLFCYNSDNCQRNTTMGLDLSMVSQDQVGTGNGTVNRI